MTQRERMNADLIYNPKDWDLVEEQLSYMEKNYDYNLTRPSEEDKRQAMMREMFASVGEGCHIEPPFYANWGGKHVHLGKEVYANFHLTLVDDGEIYIGDYVMFGPNVTVATASHTLEPSLRIPKLEFNRPVRIGSNVWIGSGAVILPGVSIGDGSVIGAGSVVTRDIPAGVLAVGNPCRVLREIGEHDREYYYKQDKIDWENLREFIE